MSVIVRLQNLPWAANAVDIRQYFHGLSIPEGGVHIVGGELGDAFIAFSTDEDARQAMLRDGGKVKEIKIKLYLSSRAEMQKIIEQARQQSLGMQQFMAMPTMQQMTVPVSNMQVPNMSVPNVAMPQNVQNIHGMQVPLQNMQNVPAMVSHHMVPKPNDTNVVPPPAPPAVGMIPAHQPDPPQIPTTALTSTTTTSASGTASAVTSAPSSSIKDSEKDKKDKRRRRTRSHSRDRSDSRSRSRSGSRSRSRSKDHKGRDRDRYYDRRRRRSRSRDRRRRRDRSRSRDRFSRDKRRDHRHGSKDDADDSSQQSGSSSRWNAGVQRGGQQVKPHQDFVNRPQLNQGVPGGPRGVDNMNNIRPPFPKPNVADQSRFNPPNPNINANVNSTPRQPVPLVKNDDKTPKLVKPNIDMPLIPPQPPASVSNAKSLSNTNTMSPSENFFGNFQQNPPVFNPQQIVSYPSFSSSSGMGSHNSGFNIAGPQMQKEGNINQVGSANSQESFDSRKQNVTSVKPNLSPSLKQQTNSNQMMFNKPQPKQKPNKPDIPSEMMANDIPLPDNSSMQTNNAGSGWEYGGGINYGVPNRPMNRFSNFEKDNSNPAYQEQFQPPSDWEDSQKINSNPEKIPNSCVQIKSVPARTTAEDIRAFFRNANIPSGWLKILGCDSNKTEGIAYVRFTSLRDKKQAILRSGCLLNNAIVTVLHVDDIIYEKAVDAQSDYTPPSGFWNINTRDQINRREQLMKEMVVKPPEKPPLMPLGHKESEKKYNCIKIEGSMRYHPFFTHNHKMYPHIRSVCDRYKPVDVCVTKMGGQNLNGYMKFENPDIMDSVMKSLSNAKIEGRPVSISLCSEDEFRDGKHDCMPLDTQKFLKNARLPRSSRNDFDSKQDNQNQTRKSRFSDPRTKPIDEEFHNDEYDDDVEMKIEEEALPEPPRNKVLLPTPPAPASAMHPPFEANMMMPTNCIAIHNLPFQTNDHDILDFFSDIGVIPTQIHLMLGPNGKPSGDAFCEFEKSEEADSAATKNNCPMGRNSIFVRLVSREEMLNTLGMSINNPALGPGPNMSSPAGPPFFNGPPGPPMFGSVRPEQPRGDWGPSFHPPGPLGPPGPPYQDSFNSNIHGVRGGGRGGRGGRGSERGIRGKDRGRGSSRGGSFRGSSSRSGLERGERGGRSRGRGGSSWDMSERSAPPPLMGLPQGPSRSHNPAQVQLEDDTVREFGKSGCVVAMENVPYRANINDILDFFGDFNLTPECVIRRYDDDGRITGDARVAFENPSEARRAIKFHNREMIGNRTILLSYFK